MKNLSEGLKFDAQGLITAIVQDCDSGDVLMQAFMNQEALELTVTTKKAVFWSRSRNALWKKGETSGMVLQVEEVLCDCDGDSILLKARFAIADGVACHTGRTSCFYQAWRGNRWDTILDVKHDPTKLYQNT